jgi:CheY-like chemotaxis protein
VFVDVRKGEGLASLACDALAPRRVALHFSVRDTGIGIPEDKQSTIFEAFRQTDNSITRRFGGTGLGLSISTQLVGLMGGRIWVESQPGQGSTFHFVVPLTIAEAIASADPGDLAGRRALLVSTSASSGEVYGDLLEQAGMSCDVVALDAKAITAALSSHPNLLLLDVSAAGAGEMDLIESLQKNRSAELPPLVLLLPAGRTDDAQRCQALGLEHCLTKPAKPQELMHAALSALGLCQESDDSAQNRTARGPSRTLRLLVADDSPVNLEVAAGLLELRGHEVTTVANGQEAIDAWQHGDFDAILMDVEMNVMDGLTATARIRELETFLPNRQPIPILALTAHALKGFEQRCREAGMDGYVAKPLQPEELYQALEALPAAEPLASVPS